MRISRILLWLLLALEFLYTLIVLLNYDNAWAHPEKTTTHWRFLENGITLNGEDWARGLDLRVTEMGFPRMRPFSNLFELLNAKFRAGLWHIVPFHPSVSLTWPFLFLLLPWLLYRFLRKMGCGVDTALMGLCLFLASVGFLGPVSMLFHPGKSFVNVFSVLALLFAARLAQCIPDPSASGRTMDLPGYWRQFAYLYITLLVTFFWDETGLFAFVLIFVLFAPLLTLRWLRFKQGFPVRNPPGPDAGQSASSPARRLRFQQCKPLYLTAGLYTSLIFVYFFIIAFILPAIHRRLGDINVDVNQYFWKPSLKDLLLPDLHNMLLNYRFLFNDHLHLYPLNQYPHAGVMALGLLAHIGMAVVAGLLIATLLRIRKTKDQLKAAQPVIIALVASAVLMLLYGWFQNFQMAKAIKTWGVWWYGNLFSLLVVIFLTLGLTLIHRVFAGRAWRFVVVAAVWVIAIDSLVFMTYRNNIMKIDNLSHYILPEDIFSGRVNQFDYFDFKSSFTRHNIKYRYARNVWDVVNGRSRRFSEHDIELANPGTFALGPLKSVLAVDYDEVLNESQPMALGNIKGLLNAELLHTTRNPTNFVLIPDQLYFADVNGDKRADALYWDTSINDRGYFSVGLSRGGAVFSRFALSLVYPVEAKTVSGGQRMNYADVNGDGRADVLYYETVFQNAVFVSLATGTGFTQPIPCLQFGKAPRPPVNPRQLQFADVNGDRLADAIYFDTRNDNGLWVSLFIKGSGIMKPALWAQYGKSSPEQLQLADVNGDGKADAIYFDTQSNGLWVSLSTGIGFAKPVLWAQYGTPATPEQIQFADVNGDDKADVLYFNRTDTPTQGPESGRGVWVRLSTGTQFGEPSRWLAFQRIVPHVMRYADINGDRKADALFTDPVEYQMAVALSTGSDFTRPVRAGTILSR